MTASSPPASGILGELSASISMMEWDWAGLMQAPWLQEGGPFEGEGESALPLHLSQR